MPPLKATKRRKVIEVFKSFGFIPVTNQGRHGTHIERGRLSIAFPTYEEFSIKLLLQLMKEANISRREWENA
jgi:predicted RNA binding protein YcfA (HicA-like mRNA interferase family)